MYMCTLYRVYNNILQVDLAGSENIGRSGAADKRAREAGTMDNIHCTCIYQYSVHSP